MVKNERVIAYVRPQRMLYIQSVYVGCDYALFILNLKTTGLFSQKLFLPLDIHIFVRR